VLLDGVKFRALRIQSLLLASLSDVQLLLCSLTWKLTAIQRPCNYLVVYSP